MSHETASIIADRILSWLTSETGPGLLALDGTITWTGFSALAGFCLTALSFLAARIEALPAQPEPVALRLQAKRILRLQSQAAAGYLLHAFVAFLGGLVLGVVIDPAVPESEVTLKWQTAVDVVPQIGCLAVGIFLLSQALLQFKALLGLSPEEEKELKSLPSMMAKDDKERKRILEIPEEERSAGEKTMLKNLEGG